MRKTRTSRTTRRTASDSACVPPPGPPVPRAAARARRRRRCPRRVDELSSERDEVRQNGDEVDDVHGVAEERRAVRTEREADRQLGREPDDAARLDDKEWVRAVVVVGSPRL